MAFFQFRKGAGDAPAATGQPESVDSLRRRARHRLIGAAVLVLAGVVSFPLVFDTQPRPVAVDIPIEIPDRNKAKPLPPPPAQAQGVVVESEAPPASKPASVSRAPAVAPAASVAAAPRPAPAPAPAPAVAPAPAPVTAAASTPAPAPAKPTPPASAKPDQVAKAAPAAPPDKPADKPVDKAPAPSEAARAQALLDGKPVQPAAEDAADTRFIVQVGAFADAAKARETRLKVERAGLKTYTHVADTKDGKRIRVRVGPFATKAEADKAASRIKELELPAVILTL
jgi:DedD protein